MRTISKLHFNRIIYGTDGQISEVNKNDCIEDVFVCDTIKVYETTSLPERNCYGIIWFSDLRTNKLFYHRFIDSSTSIDYLIDEEDEPLTHIYRNPLNTNEYLCCQPCRHALKPLANALPIRIFHPEKPFSLSVLMLFNCNLAI